MLAARITFRASPRSSGICGLFLVDQLLLGFWAPALVRAHPPPPVLLCLPLHLGFPPLALCDAWFADHPSNAAFSPFFFVIWQGDPIPEDIYEILGGGSVRSISDLQRALRIDSVGKSPLRQTLLLFL